MILSGLGSGLIFPAMSAATLACVEMERMGYAASLYNMMRNTGSAIGISLVTNLLNSREQTHRAYFAQHVTTLRYMEHGPGAGASAGLSTFQFDAGLHHESGAGLRTDLQKCAARSLITGVQRHLSDAAIMAALSCLPFCCFGERELQPLDIKHSYTQCLGSTCRHCALPSPQKRLVLSMHLPLSLVRRVFHGAMHEGHRGTSPARGWAFRPHAVGRANSPVFFKSSESRWHSRLSN
jgi:hypothetical protein